VYAVAGTLLSFGIGMGLVVAMPIQPTPSAAPPGPTHYVNLTIDVNGTTGWPYYTPANFSVPAGRVVFTITDNDSPVNWSGCPCTVRGTVGGVELVNGTPTSHVSSDNVAHTFSIEPLGLQILSPGLSVVQFTVDILGPGDFTWFCLAPCGAGSDPYSTPPMGTPGMMSGTMTVT
jgi:heme/copper-type cytochrome/quinol oxidase subunit 2